MATTFEFIRERLLEAGRSGMSPADLLKEVRLPSSQVAGRRRGTYNSFMRAFHTLKQLGWVELMRKTEPSFQRGVETSGVLANKAFYRITKAGRDASPDDWANPLRTRFPQFWGREYRARYYFRTGRPRGRPRRPRRAVVERPPAVVEIPPVVVEERPPAVVEGRPPRERRVIRFPTSQRVYAQLAQLLPRVEELRETRDMMRLATLSGGFGLLVDQVTAALRTARGDERVRLEELDALLVRVSNALADMEEAVTPAQYREAWERLVECCRGRE